MDDQQLFLKTLREYRKKEEEEEEEEAEKEKLEDEEKGEDEGGGEKEPWMVKNKLTLMYNENSNDSET